jgi:hypothetical protein
MSYYALELAPAKALATIDAPGGMIAKIGGRLTTLWPELARTFTV